MKRLLRAASLCLLLTATPAIVQAQHQDDTNKENYLHRLVHELQRTTRVNNAHKSPIEYSDGEFAYGATWETKDNKLDSADKVIFYVRKIHNADRTNEYDLNKQHERTRLSENSNHKLMLNTLIYEIQHYLDTN